MALRLVGLRAAYWFSVALGALGMCIAALFILLSRKQEGTGNAEKPAGVQLAGPKSGEQSPESVVTPMMSSDALSTHQAAGDSSGPWI